MGRTPMGDKAKNRDKVSDDHRCQSCNKGKDEVNFSVTVGTEQTPYYVRNLCHYCYNKKSRKEIVPKEIRKNRFKEKFKEYVW